MSLCETESVKTNVSFSSKPSSETLMFEIKPDVDGEFQADSKNTPPLYTASPSIVNNNPFSSDDNSVNAGIDGTTYSPTFHNSNSLVHETGVKRESFLSGNLASFQEFSDSEERYPVIEKYNHNNSSQFSNYDGDSAF